MQMVDISVLYTDEEKEAFKEEYDCRNLLEDREHELNDLEREWNSYAYKVSRFYEYSACIGFNRKISGFRLICILCR